MLLDAHTHNPEATDAIISVGPQDTLLPGHLYSIGLHPWHVTPSSTIDPIRAIATDPRVVAIGETDLDRLRGASLADQQRLLLDHIDLSEELGKPLILHSVRTAEDLLALRRRIHPSQPWIIHGFRGKPAAAERLLQGGFYLSLGPRFNPETALIIPPDRLLIETDDEQSTTIDTVAQAVASARAITPRELKEIASANLARLILQKL